MSEPVVHRLEAVDVHDQDCEEALPALERLLELPTEEGAVREAGQLVVVRQMLLHGHVLPQPARGPRDDGKKQRVEQEQTAEEDQIELARVEEVRPPKPHERRDLVKEAPANPPIEYVVPAHRFRRDAFRLTPRYPGTSAVAVAQLVEPRVVVPVVGGSSPLRHPSLDGRHTAPAAP